MEKFYELLSEKEKDFFEKVSKCVSIEEKLELMQEMENLTESTGDAEIPFIDMSVEEYVKKYNLVIRDDFG